MVKCVATIVYKEGQTPGNVSILIGRRTDNGLWGCPGGHVDPGEMLEEAARREAKEEAGIVLGKIKKVNQVTLDDPGYEPCIDTIYSTNDFEGLPFAKSDEFSELRWVKFNQLKNMSGLYKPFKLTLEEFYKEQPKQPLFWNTYNNS